MRTEARERGTNEAWDALDKKIDKAFPKSDHIKETKLIQRIKSGLDKVTEDDIKIFNFGDGARQKIQFTQYPTICQNNRQIFDTTGIFKTMSQVDSLAHKVGSEILQYLFIVRKGIELSRRSRRFKEREDERNFRGLLYLMEKDLKDLCDHLNKKIINPTKLEKEIEALIEDFETESEREIAASFADDFVNSGEIERSRNRLAVEDVRDKKRKFSRKYSKLKAVDCGDT